MSRFAAPLAAAILATLLNGPLRADDARDANAVLDKAIQAVGGTDRLGKMQGYTVKGKGTISVGGTDNHFTSQATVQGIDHCRAEFAGEFGGNKVQAVTVLSGGKGWRKFGDTVTPLEGGALAAEKQSIYLQIVVTNPAVLKGHGFKLATGGEETVDGKPAVGLKGTGPDGKEFTLYFDKQSGLPVRLKATVTGFMGQEVRQETTYSDFKDFGGVKKATRATAKRDGEPFMKQELTEFKPLEKAAPDVFAEPK
jgi:hypothetical protein